MKLMKDVYLVGSGRVGCSISNDADCHVYLIANGDESILIDAGVGIEVDRIIDNIKEEGIDPKSVKHLFLTHVHSDHAAGTAELKQKLGVKVYISDKEAHLMRSGDEEGLGLVLAKADNIYPQDYVFPVCNPDVEITGDQEFKIGNLIIEAIHTPGHSEGSISYLIKINGKKCLFCGDVVVHGGLLMFLNCPGTTMEGYRKSMPKLGNRGIEGLFPGHHCFVLNKGQEHIDKAIEALKHVVPPPNAL